ncbi:kinase-like domain-containing protein [Armillaria luteobubalina]|uniref:non-specific serine/threonine protein kinase n=1 Tax=Armillaria luteobubalina TaxID=153913 RepID=A0AA39PMY3_9AGAR|nr:kinase-like domain-containing protein [Armillaria luteobubalina]
MLLGLRHFLTARFSSKASPTPQVLLHPAKEGDVLNQQYSLKRRLGAGFGTRSTMWLSRDSLTGNDVVLKITGADSTDAGKYSQLEVDFLQKVKQVRGSAQQQHIIGMMDYFSLNSSFRTHSCLVLEVLGISIEELTQRTLPNKFPIPMCKQIIKQVLLGLDFLHRECGIVHTDLKLDNFLLCLEDTKGIPMLGDSALPIDLSSISLGPLSVVITNFGVASHIEKPFDGVIQPYALRAPEVYLGIPYSSSADIWSMAYELLCFIYFERISQAFELVTYCWLFNPEALAQWSQEDDHLGQMVSINRLTMFPVDVLACGKFSAKYFGGSGNLLKYNVRKGSIVTMIQTRYPLQPKDGPELLADMLSRMLRLHIRKNPFATYLPPRYT